MSGPWEKYAQSGSAAGKPWDKYKGTATDTPEDRGAFQAGARKFADLATFGFGDEISGAAQAVKGAVEKGTLSDLGTDYRANRDQYREDEEAASQQHPVARVVGGSAAFIPQLFAGGAGVVNAAKQGLGPALRTGALEGAAYGGASGAGESQSDLSKGDVEGFSKDAIDSAGIGAGVGVAGGLVAKGIGAGVKAYKNKDVIISGIKEGAENAKTLGLPGIDAVQKYMGGAKGARNALDEVGHNASEISALKQQSVGSGKILDQAGAEIPSLGNDDMLGLASLQGDKRVNEYLAAKAAQAQPGQLDTKQLEHILNMTPERRISAREFDNKAVAKEIAPLVDQISGEFDNALGSGFSKLQNQAAKKYQINPEQMNDLESFAGALVRPGEHSIIPAKDQTAVKQAIAAITHGSGEKGVVGVEHFGINDTPLTAFDQGQAFKRLQFSRELVDEKAKYFAQNGMTKAENLMSQFRGKIDDMLKSVSEKEAGDDLYSKGIDIKKRLFSATEFRNANGKTDIDEFKIAKLFNDNDSAGRFGNAIQDAREYLKNPNLDAATSERMTSLLDKLDSIRGRAQDKRAIDALRFREGPSSPAIERLGNQLSKEGIPNSAINNPSAYINSRDQFIRTYAQDVFGKPFSQLDKVQQTKLLKAHVWLQNNPKSSLPEQQKVFGKIFAP